MTTPTHDHADDHGRTHAPSDYNHDEEHEHDEGHDHHRVRGVPHWLIEAVPFLHHHEVPLFVSDLDASASGIWATKVSLAGLGLTAVLQVIVVMLTGSVALLADTVHNFVDAATSIPLWIAFALSTRAPSRRFTYGYSRAEDLAGVLIVLMVAASAVLVGYEALDRIARPRPIEHLWLVMLAAVIGFAGNEAVAIFRIRIGRQIGSAALVADGQHARADGLTSLSVLVGAVAVALGLPWADPAIGLAIGVAILLIARGSVVEVWNRLLDGVEPQLLTQLRDAADSVEDTDVRSIRARWTGHRLRVAIEAAMDQNLSLRRSHDLAEELRHRILHANPRVSDVIVHMDPRGHAEADDPHNGTAHHQVASASRS